VAGELDERLEPFEQRDLRTAVLRRDPEAEEPLLDQPVDEVVGEPSEGVDLLAPVAELGPERARSLDEGVRAHGRTPA